MKNIQILETEFALHGMEYKKEKYDTYAGWGRRGKQVKKC